MRRWGGRFVQKMIGVEEKGSSRWVPEHGRSPGRATAAICIGLGVLW